MRSRSMLAIKLKYTLIIKQSTISVCLNHLKIRSILCVTPIWEETIWEEKSLEDSDASPGQNIKKVE